MGPGALNPISRARRVNPLSRRPAGRHARGRLIRRLLAAIATAAVVAGVFCDRGAASAFRAQTLELPAPHLAGAVRIADATGDGHLDVVVGGRDVRGRDDFGAAVFLFAGDGSGGFAARRSIHVNGPPDVEDLAVGELTGDGVPDIAVVVDGSDKLIVLGGRGERRLTRLTQEPTAIALADVNRDGRLDALIQDGSDEEQNPGRVWLGNGRGGFTAGGPFPSGGNLSPGAVHVADLNRDGLLDTVAQEFPDKAWIGLGNGDGTFRQAPALLGPRYAVALGDLNGDGWLDAAGTDEWDDSGSLKPYLGGPNGWDPRPWWVDHRGFFDADIADADGDGRSDVIASVGFDGAFDQPLRGFTVLFGDGQGGFLRELHVEIRLRRNAGQLYDIAVGDLDEDGRADAAGVHGFDYEGDVSVITRVRADEPLRAARLVSGTNQPGAVVQLSVELALPSRVTVAVIPRRPRRPAARASASSWGAPFRGPTAARTSLSTRPTAPPSQRDGRPRDQFDPGTAARVTASAREGQRRLRRRARADRVGTAPRSVR